MIDDARAETDITRPRGLTAATIGSLLTVEMAGATIRAELGADPAGPRDVPRAGRRTAETEVREARYSICRTNDESRSIWNNVKANSS
jgi:hypothetical protein